MSQNPDEFLFAGARVTREPGWKVLLPKEAEESESLTHKELANALGDELDEWEEIWAGDASWKRVVIAIPDSTRRTPIRRVWEALEPALTKRGFAAKLGPVDRCLRHARWRRRADT